MIAKKQKYNYTTITAPPTNVPVQLYEEYSKVVVELAERYVPWVF